MSIGRNFIAIIVKLGSGLPHPLRSEKVAEIEYKSKFVFLWDVMLFRLNSYSSVACYLLSYLGHPLLYALSYFLEMCN